MKRQRKRKAPDDKFLQAAIDSYRYRYESGDCDDITFMQGLLGKNFSHPSRIVDAVFHEDGTTIDVHFENQDHVAMYYVIDGRVSFQGFES